MHMSPAVILLFGPKLVSRAAVTPNVTDVAEDKPLPSQVRGLSARETGHTLDRMELRSERTAQPRKFIPIHPLEAHELSSSGKSKASMPSDYCCLALDAANEWSSDALDQRCPYPGKRPRSKR